MSESLKQDRPRLTLRALATDKTLALMLGLGFSSGLPILLVFSTQSARLREAGVDVKHIGLLSYVALCYSLKFFWSPLMDSYGPPVLSTRLGRRRAWMLVAQIAVAIGLTSQALCDPRAGLPALVAASFFTAFAGATQDIVVDAWRIEAAPEEKQGLMSAVYQLGYSIARVCAGAGAFYLADAVSWRLAYEVMASLMIVGITANLLAPRMPERPARPRGLALVVMEPLRDLFDRRGWWLIPILVLIALYRLPDFLTGVMANVLYVDLGFSNSEIATASKLYGIWVGIAGAFLGGLSIARLGLLPSLLIGAGVAASSHLAMAWLALHGHVFSHLIVAVSIENLAGGFAGTVLIAYMSSLTSSAFAASQYALLSSLYALPGKVVGGLSGFLVARFGYVAFFSGSSLIGIPLLLLVLLVWFSERRRSPPVGAGAAAAPEPPGGSR